MQQIVTRQDAIAWSKEVCEKLASDDPVLQKQAQDTVTRWTRTKVREDGIYRKVLPMQPVTNADLDRQWDTSLPAIVIDREPESPAAISIPFNQTPDSIYIRADRYRVLFSRITTSRFTADVDTLRTWEMDIRQVLSDNAIRDMLAEEDTKFFRAFNTALVGQDTVVPQSGVVQWQKINGGITRDNYWQSLKIMANTPSNLEAHTGIINQVTVKDFGKFTHNEMGGTLAEEIMKNGWSLQKFGGLEWVVTVKKGLVPTNTVYYTGDPNFIGFSFALEDTVMFVRREAWRIDYYAYETIGGSFGWISGLARADFA